MTDNYQHLKTQTEQEAKLLLPMLETLPKGIDPDHRNCILWTAIGLPARMVAAKLGKHPDTIYDWRFQYEHEIANLAQVAKRVVAQLITHQVAALVETGSDQLAKYQSQKGRVTASDLLQIARAAEILCHVAQAMRSMAGEDESRPGGQDTGVKPIDMDAAIRDAKKLVKAESA